MSERTKHGGKTAFSTAMSAIVAGTCIAGMIPAAALADSGSADITYGTGTITIVKGAQGEAAANDTVQYAVYQIFKANVVTVDNVDHLKNIVWGDGINAEALCGFLQQEGYTLPTDPTYRYNPQKAAEFISQKIAQSAASDIKDGDLTASNPTADQIAEASYKNVNTPYKYVDADTFADRFATWLKNNVRPANSANSPVEVNKPYTATEGYYFFTAVDDFTASTDPTVANTINLHEAGSAPIFTTIGGSVTQITEKVSVPTVTKWVLDDAANNNAGKTSGGVYAGFVGKTESEAKDLGYSKAADANTLQPVDYKLCGTLPTNLSSYDYYYYGFTDVIPQGMDVDLSTVKVSADGRDCTGSFRVVYDTTTYQNAAGEGGIEKGSKILYVFCNDILGGGGADKTKWVNGVKSGGDITVDYQASLNANANVGSFGNVNSVFVTYSHNPTIVGNGQAGQAPSTTTQPNSAPDTSDTPIDYTITFTYDLDVTKIDKSTNELLPYFAFVVQNKDGAYINHDGSISTNTSTPVATYESSLSYTQNGKSWSKPSATSLADDRIFFTDADGNFNIHGLDEDVYTLTEIAVPQIDFGFYDLLDHPIVITIDSNIEAVGQGTASHISRASVPLTLTANLDGLDASLGKVKASDNHDGSAVEFDASDAVDADSGTVNVWSEVMNTQNIPMPVTGQDGVALITGVGAAVVGISLGGVLMNRRRRQAAE